MYPQQPRKPVQCLGKMRGLGVRAQGLRASGVEGLGSRVCALCRVLGVGVRV